jgi:hypothetical protein
MKLSKKERGIINNWWCNLADQERFNAIVDYYHNKKEILKN